MRAIILSLAMTLVLGTASAQIAKVQFTKSNQPYATTSNLVGGKGKAVGSTWGTQKLKLSYSNFGDLFEESFVMYFNFGVIIDLDIPKGANILLKLGNDSLVTVQNLDKSYGKYLSSSSYRSSFYASTDLETAEKIAIHGIKKVRLAFSDIKLDWLLDKGFEKTRSYARAVLDADLKVSVESDNDDF